MSISVGITIRGIKDERREKVLSALELRVVRFGNDEVAKDLSAVVEKIREQIL